MNDPIAVSTYLVPSTRVLQLAANSSGTLTNTNYPLAAPASTERVTELRWVNTYSYFPYVYFNIRLVLRPCCKSRL